MTAADHADDDATLDDLVDRLERAAEQLRSGDLSADAAATVVEDCAALASQASAELERRSREAERDPRPGQDQLL
jgi:exonuclease VII small subunit